jgi:hypothetical protein
MTAYWIGVASREHVQRGVASSFCQLCHGKAAPVRRLKSGDRIVYYSPRVGMRQGEPVQAFTAIGEIAEGDIERVDMSNGVVLFRRCVSFYRSSEAAIQPLLPVLSVTRNLTNWGLVFRRGAFSMDRADYEAIAHAVGVAAER